MTDERRNASVRAALMADLLATGRSLDIWSLAFALLAGAALIMASRTDNILLSAFLGFDLCLALAQKYYALRTALDAAIFRRWAETWSVAGPDIEDDLRLFDVALGKRQSTCRPLVDRIRGARGLLLRQAVCFVAQVSCFVVSVCLCC